MFANFAESSETLDHSSFSKFLKIMHCQSFYVQAENTRYQLQHSLNTFVNIAKNQNYDKNHIELSQLVEIYLGFEDSNSTGEILLSEMTYISKTSKFRMGRESFPIFRQLMKSVLNNIENKLKYERKDYLNKEFTHDTINFLKEFLPKYVELWPEVIFEIKNGYFELLSDQKNTAFEKSVLKVFEKITKTSK